MVIIGITGTLGAGKGEIVLSLKKIGFAHFSARDFLVEELIKRGSPINRDTTTALANELRETHSPGYIIERLYAMALAKGQNAVIESVRAIGEVDFLRRQVKENSEVSFFLIAVDADPKVRYSRVVSRASWLDHVSFEKFLFDEEREMRSTDPTKGNIAECVRRADYTIRNDGDRAELAAQVEKIVSEIMPK